MSKLRDNNQKILALLKSNDDRNIELAFQLCVGLDRKYSKEVSHELKGHIFLCAKYEIEKDYYLGFETLDLERRLIGCLPPSIGKFKNLKKLILKGNKLTKLPSEIKNLQALQVIDISFNNFIEIPNEIGCLSNLEELNANNNKLTSVFINIGKLKKLQILNLGINKIKELPKEVEGLSTLKTLNLMSNSLSNLPQEIGNLIELKKLSLVMNNLVNIPEEVTQLKKLEVLSLTDNHISTLPVQIGELEKLKQLYIARNPITVTEKERLQGALANCTIVFQEFTGKESTEETNKDSHLCNNKWWHSFSSLFKKKV